MAVTLLARQSAAVERVHVLLAVTVGLSGNLTVGGFGGTVLGALLISIVTTLLEVVLRRLGLSRPAARPGLATPDKHRI